MGIKLKAIRNDKNVQLSLIFTNVVENDFELYNAKIIETENKENIAVILHFGNISEHKVKFNLFSFKSLSLVKTFEINKEIKNIRVFYWNDNLENSLEGILDCIKDVFVKILNNEIYLPIGDIYFENYCKGFMQPRQGGNGGVVGITEI